MCRCVLCLPPAQPDAPNCAASGRQRVHPIPFQHLLPSPSSQPEFPCTHVLPSSPPQWLRRARGSLDRRPIRLQKPVDCAWSRISVNLGGGVRRGVGWGLSGEGRGPACSLSAVPPRWERASLNSQPIFCPSQHFIPSLELSSGPGAVTS